jgi:hypothetical protein
LISGSFDEVTPGDPATLVRPEFAACAVPRLPGPELRAAGVDLPTFLPAKSGASVIKLSTLHFIFVTLTFSSDVDFKNLFLLIYP